MKEVIDLTASSPSRSAIYDDVPENSFGRSSSRTRESNPVHVHSHHLSKPMSPITVSDDEESASGNKSDSTAKKKRRKRSKKGKNAGNTNGKDAATDKPDATDLFFFDEKAEKCPGLNEGDGEKPKAAHSLILPQHVTVDEGGRIPDLVLHNTALSDSDADDFINYADAETATFRRYYEEEKDPSMAIMHVVCGHCGAEGDHKTLDCTVLVCLTCGAHNEHTTRQCPIIKKCYSCGMKGHINRDCPNRFSAQRLGYDAECDRCGSEVHKTPECPTIWRIYKYLKHGERQEKLGKRESAIKSQIGVEEFIGQSFYCYQCGEDGHLGDDCPSFPSRERDYSAFGLLNAMSGPFSEDMEPSQNKQSRANRKENGMFDDGYGFSGPSDVGKRGREKERERLRKHEKDRASDEEDWFAKSRGNKPKPASENGRGSKGGQTSFKFSDKDRQRPAEKQKLESRLSSNRPSRDERGRNSRSDNRGSRSQDRKDTHGGGRSSGESARRRYFGGYGR